MVHVEHFAMAFGNTRVIEDLSFDVRVGETFGFLGSNGSGKTTTIRCLLGIFQPSAGILHINGRPFKPGQSGELGYLPEERGLYKKESVLDAMSYFGRLKGLSAREAKQWSLNYLERVGLADKASLQLEKLSGGQQQKVQLGVTIMNHPALLILDEPAKGFDPVNRRLLMDIIDEQKNEGSTVVMVTHQMDEVERLCDRILLLKDGRARAYGAVSDVQEQFGGNTVQLSYEGRLPVEDSFTVIRDNLGHAELSLANGVKPSALLRSLVESGVIVSSFTSSRRSLDSIFVEVYGAQDEGE
ncbi:MAG: ATP-binding cassette domain-containing protein [Propionibacteriaceae bacterium]|nr:ATP-binding cassette domain-containing protein [Propionibacteriaceae bacterium]